jgi:hypothetical protein
MGLFDPAFSVWEPKFRHEGNIHLNTATSCRLQCIQSNIHLNTATSCRLQCIQSNIHLNTATSYRLQCIQTEGSDVNRLKACLNYLILSSTIKYHVQNPLEMRTCLDHFNYFRMLDVDPVPGSQTWFASRLCSIRPHSNIKIQNTCSLSIIKLLLSRNENKLLGVCRNFKYNFWPAAVHNVPNRGTYSLHVVSSLSFPTLWPTLPSRAPFSRHSSALQFIAAADSLVVTTARLCPYPEPDIPTPNLNFLVPEFYISFK